MAQHIRFLSDDNELNKALEEQNDSFSDLLELEAKFCK